MIVAPRVVEIVIFTVKRPLGRPRRSTEAPPRRFLRVQSVVFSLPSTPGLAGAVDALARFYAPLGQAGSHTLVVPGGAVGWIALTADEHQRLQAQARERVLTWGEEAHSGAGATFDWRSGTLATTPHQGFPVSLYRAGDAVATHAVAAAWLARRRRPRVRFDLVPELLLHEFVLGDESMVEGVAPVAAPVAWPELQSEVEAPAAALEALLETLAARLQGSAAPALGLTAGLDSRVVAAALRRLELPVRTFTWSHHEQDAAGAAAVAGRLGLPHLRCPPEWLGDAEGLAQLQADVRWSEGQARLTPFGRVTWPPSMTCFVTGGGGETGRAFYYRLVAANRREPDTAQLVRVMSVRERFPHASREAVADLERRLAAELDQLPYAGWRRLDAFYAQRRVARWGRAMLGRAAAPTVAAFATPAVAAALIAMSERDRTTDGFHRHALRVLAGEELPAAGAQRRGVPRPLRRLAAGARRDRAPDARWAYAGELPARPRYTQWLDDALAEPALAGVLGPQWAQALRAGVAAGHDAPLMQALLATAPVALEEALRELPEAL